MMRLWVSAFDWFRCAERVPLLSVAHHASVARLAKEAAGERNGSSWKLCASFDGCIWVGGEVRQRALQPALFEVAVYLLLLVG
jgi:hypothetical protein